MSKNIIPQIPSKASTIISSGANIQGNIEGIEDFEISGIVNGSIKVDGNVYILNKASILGNIDATNILVEGTVNGNIDSNGIIRISKTAVVNGSIQTNTLLLDSQSSFKGICCMTESPCKPKQSNYVLPKESETHDEKEFVKAKNSTKKSSSDTSIKNPGFTIAKTKKVSKKKILDQVFYKKQALGKLPDPVIKDAEE